MGKQKEYYAFISYKREDEKWAKWLQNKLEHYRFPTNLNGRTDLPKHIRPTFRDVTDLTPGLLSEEIDKALRSSEWLIVICSPRSAKSPWVCKEAQTFIDLGRADHIIPFVIEGTPFSKDSASECYPEALLNLTEGQELLAANIHEMGRDAATIKVVARMFNLHFDTLWRRHKREKKNKTLSVVFLLLLFILISIYVIFTISNLKTTIYINDREIENQQRTIEGQFKTIEEKNVKLTVKNDSLKHAYISNEIALAENRTTRGECVSSLLELYSLRDYKSDLKLNKKYCDALLNNYKYICKYPVVLIDINNEEKLIEDRIYHEGDSVSVNDSTYIWMHNEGLFISNNTGIIDTISLYSSTAILTNDKKYLVYSDRDSILYFYDTSKFTSKPVFASKELFVWYYWGGGVREVSHDNNMVLYEAFDREGSQTFIINLKEQKISHDLSPLSQMKKSPNGMYKLISRGPNAYISKTDDTYKTKLLDPIFNINSSGWSSGNTLVTNVDSLSLAWKIQNIPQEVMSFESNYPVVDVEISPDNKSVAILTTNELYIYDLSSKNLIHRKTDIDLSYPDLCTFSSDSKKLACVDIYGMIYLYDFTCNSSSYLGGYYDEMANCGDNFQISFINRYLALYNDVDFCYALFDINEKNKEIVKHKKILHLNQNNIYFENDSVLCYVNEPTNLWHKVNVDTLNTEPKKMFPIRLKPKYDRDSGYYHLPKPSDRNPLSWKDTYYSLVEEDNQSYSYVEYNSDSTLFIIVNPYEVYISRTAGILDELYYQCLF